MRPWTVTRPDGQVWARRFASEQAAWGFIVRGCNSRHEWLARRADMMRAGWRVWLRPPNSLSNDRGI